ncbi:hypothetical protein [Streptomyces spiralis]|uniref:hypothetical protein n=1 Tax=Streptomyces spiralis TaxID=66376 RepID=UPI0036A2AAB6
MPAGQVAAEDLTAGRAGTPTRLVVDLDKRQGYALARSSRRTCSPCTDPPPYRENAVLRGPRHLHLDVTGVRP